MEDEMKIFIGADHGAKELKEYLIENLRKENHEVTDCFIKNESETDDYPDTAYLVCKSVMNTKDSVGIVLCKDGIGMSIAANKYKGIRCARILNKNDAFKSRSHSDANVQAVKELGKYYPYGKPTYTKIRNFMTDLTKSGLDETTIDQIHEYMLRYMIGLDEQSKFNPEYPINLDNGETVRAEDYYTKYVPLKVSNLLRTNKELKSLPIFSLLTFEEGNDGNVQMKIADSGALTPTQKDEVRDSWEVLLTNPELSQVAKDLYMYSYYQSGFGFGVIGFNHLAPLELKLQLDLNGETSYTSFLDNVLDDNIPVDEVRFAQMFLSTHRDNNRLVYEPKSKQYNYIKSYVYQNGMPVDSFILDVTTDKNKVKPFILRSTKEEVHYRPAILVDGLLYVANGSAFNRSTSGAMEYRLVKGKNNKKVSLSDIGVQDDKSSTVIDGEPIVDIDTMSVDNLVDELVKSQVKTGALMAEEAEEASRGIRSNILQTTKEDAREQLIGALLEEYRKLGVSCKLNGEKIC